jgi:hypothetical protein
MNFEPGLTDVTLTDVNFVFFLDFYTLSIWIIYLLVVSETKKEAIFLLSL